MKITALVENQTTSELKAKHGLSLYIETASHKILFDLGPDNTLFENAKIKQIDLTEVDTVIISHGHADHGGALEQFLKMNTKAKIYIQRSAFMTHYSKVFFFKVSIGLDRKLETHPQIVLVDGDYQIDKELNLFTVKQADKCCSPVNSVLYDKNGQDMFLHEQNLIIMEEKKALIMGCGHKGIINIMEKAKRYRPSICVGGYHLFNPMNKKTVSDTLLNEIAKELSLYSHIQFYTCHCTGLKAFQYLSKRLPNMSYLSCGETIQLN